MNRALRWSILAVMGVAMATQFTNCGNYAEPAVYSDASTILSCDADCIVETVDNLSVKANTGTSAEYTATIDIAEFNLGGECNEGGFPQNVIRWELYLNGQKVRDSGMLGTGGSGAVANTVCANGRFSLYVYLGSIGEDPVNRQGLGVPGGGRATYELWIEIQGSTPGGFPQRNNLRGRHRVTLIPG